ncbi:unnamed protein product [Schistosoma mattheei]|uniref:Uncharacterized protein n=1 Tax=Schistosoma mattheei TaxID=31246 RepID=A0A3P7Z480_9TREM|nr:unnamed protein product [Schistosoma mattheei]
MTTAVYTERSHSHQMLLLSMLTYYQIHLNGFHYDIHCLTNSSENSYQSLSHYLKQTKIVGVGRYEEPESPLWKHSVSQF